MTTMYEALEKLVPQLNASRAARNLMEVFPRTIQFSLDDPAGPFQLRIAGGRAALEKGRSAGPELEVSGNSKALARVITEKVDITWPIAEGHATCEKGKISELTLLNRILWAAERKDR